MPRATQPGGGRGRGAEQGDPRGCPAAGRPPGAMHPGAGRATPGATPGATPRATPGATLQQGRPSHQLFPPRRSQHANPPPRPSASGRLAGPEPLGGGRNSCRGAGGAGGGRAPRRGIAGGERKGRRPRGRQTRHHGGDTQYLLLIFIPGKETEGGPLFPSAKLVVLGRPLIVGKVQIRRKLSKIPFHFTRTRESRAQLRQAGPCFLLYYLPCRHH